MICKYCQLQIVTNFPYPSTSKQICCRTCRQDIFDNKRGWEYYKENGEIAVLWKTFTDPSQYDNYFRIYFHYDVSKTVFTRFIAGKEKVVAQLGYTMPVREEHIEKAKKNLKLWQVFS